MRSAIDSGPPIILAVASGREKTKPELNGYFEIGILRDGITT